MGTQGWQGEPHGHGEPKERRGEPKPGKQGCLGRSQEGGISRAVRRSQAGAWLSGWGLALWS